MFLDVGGLDFVDRCGIVRTVYGCSLRGRFEFADRLQQLEQRLQELAERFPNETAQALYDHDRQFRFLCDRCLTLNQIDPDWLTWEMAEQLLFSQDDKPGVLIQINNPAKRRKNTPTTAQTYAQALAALSSHTASLEEAIRLAEEVPADLLLDVLEARAATGKDAAKQKQEQARALLAKMNPNAHREEHREENDASGSAA